MKKWQPSDRRIRQQSREAREERGDEMTVDEILNTDQEIIAAALKTAFNGVYLDEVYKGRGVHLEKTDTAYIITLTNPNARFLPKNRVEAIEIIKRELGNLPG